MSHFQSVRFHGVPDLTQQGILATERSVLDGLAADVITMNQASDIDILAERGGLVPKDWSKRLPYNSSPTASVSVILVRKGNPKQIKD